MPGPENPSLEDGWNDYDQLVTTIKRLHSSAAPEHGDDFSTETLRYVDEDGTYFYFPHPRDKEEVLRLAHNLSEGADNVRRSLLVPVAITAAHLFDGGNGRASRTAHAQLAGKSAEEISAMRINGYRNWRGEDEEAQEKIDLRLPKSLRGPLEANVYEDRGAKKQISFDQGFNVSEEGAVALMDLRDHLSPEFKSSLDETVIAVRTFNSSYRIELLDPESLAFALNTHSSESASDSEAPLDLTIKAIGNFVVVLPPQSDCKDTTQQASFGVPHSYPYVA